MKRAAVIVGILSIGIWAAAQTTPTTAAPTGTASGQAAPAQTGAAQGTAATPAIKRPPQAKRNPNLMRTKQRRQLQMPLHRRRQPTILPPNIRIANCACSSSRVQVAAGLGEQAMVQPRDQGDDHAGAVEHAGRGPIQRDGASPEFGRKIRRGLHHIHADANDDRLVARDRPQGRSLEGGGFHEDAGEFALHQQIVGPFDVDAIHDPPGVSDGLFQRLGSRQAAQQREVIQGRPVAVLPVPPRVSGTLRSSADSSTD